MPLQSFLICLQTQRDYEILTRYLTKLSIRFIFKPPTYKISRHYIFACLSVHYLVQKALLDEYDDAPIATDFTIYKDDPQVDGFLTYKQASYALCTEKLRRVGRQIGADWPITQSIYYFNTAANNDAMLILYNLLDPSITSTDLIEALSHLNSKVRAIFQTSPTLISTNQDSIKQLADACSTLANALKTLTDVLAAITKLSNLLVSFSIAE